DLTDPLTNGNGNPEASVNGNRPTSVSVQKDGIDATNLTGTGSLTENLSPAPETVEEVKVLTSLYDASLGRNGGGTVQVITRRGGNEFHGVGYLYGQNERFNANDFFFNRDGIDRQKARRLEGGGTLGGAIIKDKLFFFTGYQKTDASTAYVPSAQSLVVLPEFLSDVRGERTPQSLVDALNRSYVGNFGPPVGTFVPPRFIVCPGDPACSSPLPPASQHLDPRSPGTRLLMTRNPITGDYLVPAPRANA